MVKWCLVRAGMLLSLWHGAFALNPTLDVSQYAHSVWRIRDGFAKSQISAIVQTSDGYLWLGTGSGLFRFDGVNATPWEPPADQPLPSSVISSLVAARDGTLWIGTRNGLASWKNGKLTRYADLAGLLILRLLEDHQGSIWAGAFGVPEGKLCEIRQGSVRCYPKLGGLGLSVFQLHEDSKGNLWVGVSSGVWRLKPDPPEFYALPAEANGVQGIVDGEDGTALVTTTAGIRRLIDGTSPVAFPLPVSIRGSARGMLRDRDGVLWVGSLLGGLVHIRPGRTDLFSQADGLTGSDVGTLREDREGNVWVTTLNGLDRFRELPVVTYSTDQGVPSIPLAVLAAKDGAVWFDLRDGLSQLHRGQVTTYRRHPARASAAMREIAMSGLGERNLDSLFQDSRGRIWVSALTGIGYLENDRYISTAAPPGFVVGFTEDAAGNVWMAYQDRGLVRLSPNNEIEQIPWETFGRKDPAQVLADPVQGGLWLGFRNGGLIYFRDGRVRASYHTGNGLAEGQVNDLRFDSSGALWIATDGGLSQWNKGRVATLTSRNGLPCDGVHWTLEDDGRSVWMGMPCGLARIARSELDAWLVSDGSSRTIHATVLDAIDGARMAVRAGLIHPRASKSPDGRLWFITLDGLSVVDPRHLPFNNLPPPVQIERITADRKTYDPTAKLRLPPLTRDLEIDYTALSLIVPEKNRFKYKLEGHDRDWQDVSTRRQAFYTDLLPRQYRFRVMASNNDGVWNETGASFDFSIAPAYYQTGWFRAAIAAGVLALVWGLYRLRLYQLAREYNMRLEERVSERTRVARDLHDTLLQSFQGLMLRLQLVDDLLPEGRAKNELEQTLERADQAIAEGRSAVYDLRSSAATMNELAHAVKAVGDELATQDSAMFRLVVEGETRDLHPIIRDEVYRITREALRNAFTHARAHQIETEISYGERVFRVRVRDDGVGIPPEMLEEGRPGHYGLPGMRERAKQSGGKLEIWSGARTGTEIELRIAGSVAYRAAPDRSRFRLFRNKAG